MLRIGLAVALAAAASAQAAQILDPRLAPPQHVAVAAGADRLVAPAGGAVSLWVDVTPNPKVHVYAQGAKGFTPVAFVVSKQDGIVAGAPKYPLAEPLASPGSTEPVPAYSKPFRIVQPIAVAKTARPGQMLNVAGTLTYESCDDRLCYPALSIPVYWTVKVR